ncbi:triose-phosphate isomerase [Mycoplasmoides pneumoniae]|uniref:Triosephosphate isomerase n=4 Tax=Mycoplasmoides pneumoniae TaxID=2104 RepID=TPIS_MYCPN|nr:triose-phosphate isomerase [Mycoplasmoides pneumoniae]P78010.1 RecName: Full=Triosephosphate isomerase; Short=TIM; Short=TPI; AltName: Full=Triose-phosphate isomerase [Mycoplasmoides pneumoniae M129]AAB95861.1 triosephosphate isomerase [Mycoplasmoides pneumoniae M129]ADK86901.1 triose-phosphate isomerase [Mycoplasmoides pneumoniae FH]AGC04501.1 triosephosphate isomerase [Mycoplasmoides pneumoniae M129-B7]ALA30497.1 triosephosphate isomerase [Mycoplasmoides pneumoniae PI 1428]ALA30790.1 tri
MRTKYLIGNWKTNKDLHQALAFVEQFKQHPAKTKAVLGIAPVHVHLTEVNKVLPNNLLLLAQDANFIASGSYTGTVSYTQLQDIKVNSVIIGHSERRKYFNETAQVINQKLKACLQAGMLVVLCIGETEGQPISFLKEDLTQVLQGIDLSLLKQLVIAYEPIWAIGTGKTATPEIANNTIAQIRVYLSELYNKEIAQQTSILYGGSVAKDNIKELAQTEQIDGFLVGKASLDVNDFLVMAQVYA